MFKIANITMVRPISERVKMALALPAVRFVQKKVTMYLTALPLEELDHCSIDRWDPTKMGSWKGYQRGLVQKKIRDLAEYLERPDGILPVTGLLNVRDKNRLRFSNKRRESQATCGVLTIPDYTQLWVVDMQHRLEGIRTAHQRGQLSGFVVPVLITEGLDPVTEAAQFYVINTRSKRMGVDLTRRLLIEHDRIRDITDVKPWELKATQIAIELNQKISRDNPWYGRIREPESERRKQHVATEKSFVPSLKWLLNAPGISTKSVRHISRFLASFWEGLSRTMPPAFTNPRAYLIQKTPGFMAFHRIAPIVYRKVAREKTSPVTYERFFSCFSGQALFSDRFWNRRNLRGAKRYGTGQGAYANLALQIRNTLGV